MYFIHPFARERDRAIELSPFLHFQTELISLYSLDLEKAFSQRGTVTHAQMQITWYRRPGPDCAHFQALTWMVG